ncbi:hypothetical protein KAR91_51280 [Candidatus Pacearchaeota archaeon]|nr:hypothetical protein [Candidatus Pacearchaeota archaeon]
MSRELSTSVMASLIKSKALAGSTWKKKGKSIIYKIVGYTQTGTDVLIQFRFCNKNTKGAFGEDSLSRVSFLQEFKLVKSI